MEKDKGPRQMIPVTSGIIDRISQSGKSMRNRSRQFLSAGSRKRVGRMVRIRGESATKAVLPQHCLEEAKGRRRTREGEDKGKVPEWARVLKGPTTVG